MLRELALFQLTFVWFKTLMIHDQGLFIHSQEGFDGIASFTSQCRSEWLDLSRAWMNLQLQVNFIHTHQSISLWKREADMWKFNFVPLWFWDRLFLYKTLLELLLKEAEKTGMILGQKIYHLSIFILLIKYLSSKSVLYLPRPLKYINCYSS